MLGTIHTLSCDDAIAFVCDAIWGFAEVDEKGNFTWVNAAYCKVLSAPVELVVGTNFADWTHPEDLEIDRELARQVSVGEIPGYTLVKRYIQRGSTPQRQLVVWGLLSVAGRWNKEKVFTGYRVQFRPYNNFDAPQKRKINWKAPAPWLLENWKTVLLMLAASTSLIFGGSEKLIDVLRQADEQEKPKQSQLPP